MDNQKHTAEPWPECDTDEVINAADYSRARVCVNALAGIDDPELWVAQMKFMDSDHTASLEIIGELTKQRDELLAALKSITPLASEAMTMFQQQRGMMCQDIAKRLGKPVLAAERIINKIDHE